MKKILAILSSVLFIMLFVNASVYAASVPPQTIPGNDANPMDYTPPEGCYLYVIPNSNEEGTHTITFDENGFVDPTGDFSFTVTVGTEEGEDYTKVLSWSSNFPIYAVIVKGGDAFNLYEYETSVRGDTDLVSPDNESGMPADVSHVSVVICPEDFPPTPPTPTPTTTPTPTITPTPTPTTTPCPPCPPTPPCPSTVIFIVIIIIFIILIGAFFLLGLLLGKFKGLSECCMKLWFINKHKDNNHPVDPHVPCDDKKEYEHKKEREHKKQEQDFFMNDPCGHHKEGTKNDPFR